MPNQERDPIKVFTERVSAEADRIAEELGIGPQNLIITPSSNPILEEFERSFDEFMANTKLVPDSEKPVSREGMMEATRLLMIFAGLARGANSPPAGVIALHTAARAATIAALKYGDMKPEDHKYVSETADLLISTIGICQGRIEEREKQKAREEDLAAVRSAVVSGPVAPPREEEVTP